LTASNGVCLVSATAPTLLLSFPMRAPLVAVVGHYLPVDRITRWRFGGYAVPEGYVDSVRRAGGRPAVIHPLDLAPLDESMERFDAVVIIGGGDVDPACYGGDAHDKVYGVERQRDDAEIELSHWVVDHDMPTLAVCRGIQVVNVAFGGTLHPHIGDLDGVEPHGQPGGGPARVHEVKLAPDSGVARACRADVVQAACTHHQAVDRVGDGLTVTGRAADGIIEALEIGPVLAVQWHPETTASGDPIQQNLFDALIAAATQR
jgi:putative glutamine amidotransferase